MIKYFLEMTVVAALLTMPVWAIEHIPYPSSKADLKKSIDIINRNFKELEKKIQDGSCKCPQNNSVYPDTNHFNFCKPGSPCDLRKQESEGKDHGVKKFSRSYLYPTPHDADIGKRPHPHMDVY